MELWNPSTEPFSFTRISARAWRQTYHVHRLQWYRWVVGLVAAFQLAPNAGKLYWHYSTHHYPSVLPDFLAFTLSIAARIIWLFVFRNPGEFLGFRRPAREYRWVVGGTVALTTLPNGIVHVWALKMALKKDTIVLSGVVTATLAIVFLVPLTGVVWWMAWKFLLGFYETNEDFEPVFKKSVVRSNTGQSRDLVPAAELYRDDPSSQPTRGAVENGYLAEAYEKQRFATPEPASDRDSAGSADPVETLPQEEAHGEQSEEQEQVQEPDDVRNASATPETANPRRCPTAARFEYMSQRHSGPHSWLTYPIIPLVLSIYATVAQIVFPIFIHEDRAYRLRAPSLTLKKSLFMPLGLYLLSFYTIKHRIRASLFERFTVPPPEPWKKMLSILPSWFGTGGTFRNQDTGEITVYDPRRRALPWQAYRNAALIRTRKYIKDYNANPGTCTSYWGHSGCPTKSDLRFRPTIHRIGFLFLALYFTWKGFWITVFYDVPDEFEERLKHWKTITREDIARIRRLLGFWQGLLFPDFYFTIMGIVLAGLLMLSMLALFFKALWKYVPREEKEEVHRVAREAHEREIERIAGLG